MSFVPRRARAKRFLLLRWARAKHSWWLDDNIRKLALVRKAREFDRAIITCQLQNKVFLRASVLRQWSQQIIFVRGWNAKTLRIETNAVRPINLCWWLGVETWIATRFQNNKAKFVHTNWSKIIKVGTQTKECHFFCRNFDLAFFGVCLRTLFDWGQLQIRHCRIFSMNNQLFIFGSWIVWKKRRQS